jgi:hypothetical protein
MPITLRQRSKIIPLFGFLAIVLFIRLPWWFIYYSWRSNRPRRSWTLHRTIRAQLLRQIASLPTKYGLFDGRDLSLEVPQEELEPLSARFVWIPELKEDLVGALGEHAASAGVKSIAIPAYWILKEGSRWSPEHEKPLKDEKVMVYFHGGAFVVSFFSFEPCFRTDPRFSLEPLIQLTQRRPSPRDCSNILGLSPECCRSTTDSVLDLLLNTRTHSRARSSTEFRHTSILSARWDSCPRTLPLGAILRAETSPWRSPVTSSKAVCPTCHPLDGSFPHPQLRTCRSLAPDPILPITSTQRRTCSTSHLPPSRYPLINPIAVRTLAV